MVKLRGSRPLAPLVVRRTSRGPSQVQGALMPPSCPHAQGRRAGGQEGRSNITSTDIKHYQYGHYMPTWHGKLLLRTSHDHKIVKCCAGCAVNESLTFRVAGIFRGQIPGLRPVISFVISTNALIVSNDFPRSEAATGRHGQAEHSGAGARAQAW